MHLATMKHFSAKLFFTLVILAMVCSGAQVRDTWSHHQRDTRAYDESRALYGHDSPSHRERPSNDRSAAGKPNIVFIMTDDQDIALGSLNYMPKTRRILRDGGAFFENGFVTTPICCPSRSSILTGMYVHNHNVYTNNDNCSSPMWIKTHEPRNFGTYLSNAGYRTGYFGKYLNDYDGNRIPLGWTEWVGLIRNTRFYNYSLNVNGNKIKHGDIYQDDYLTDLIANNSATFFRQSKQYFPNRPVAMVLSMPAPHGPEDAAPQYQNFFLNNTAHRTPSWNFAPNPDKQWILQYTGKMEPIHVAFTDMLQRKRLQTLQSVDDAVEKVFNELRDLGELDNTYFLYSSDHGYHLGQYGLVKGKSMPYDFDVRVPFMMRGPKIPAGTIVKNIALNVDIAPTFLDIAGVEIPEHMDGRSLLELFDNVNRGKGAHHAPLQKKAWRDTFLIERGKITDKKIKEREKIEAEKNEMTLTKQSRLVSECEKSEYQPPCNGSQQWVCRKKEDGMLRIFKCRYSRTDENEVTPMSKCNCPDVLNRSEKKLQRNFLKQHVNQPEMLKPKFMKPKRRRRFRRDLNIDNPPLANPGPTQYIHLPQHSLLLDGTGSTDDKGIIGYRWIQTSERPLPVDMVGTRTPKLHISNLDVGEYRFALTVVDTAGQISTRSVNIIVKPGKYEPLDNARVENVNVGHSEYTSPNSKPLDDEHLRPSDLEQYFESSGSLDQQQPIVKGQTESTTNGELSSPELPPPEIWAEEKDDDDDEYVDAYVDADNDGYIDVDDEFPDGDDFDEFDENYDDYSEYFFINPIPLNDSWLQSSRPDEIAQSNAGSVFCRMLPNSTVACEEEVYNNFVVWKSEKDALDEKISQLKQELEALKDMKQHLREQRPEGADYSTDIDKTIDSDLLGPDNVADHSPGSSTGVGMHTLLDGFVDPLVDIKVENECICDGERSLSPKQQHQLASSSDRSSSRSYMADDISPREQKRLERQEKRLRKKQERQIRKLEKRKLLEGISTTERPHIDPTRDCNSKNMKCFSHNDDHWKTAPFWDSISGKWTPGCNHEGLDCAVMSNDHWRVPPFWTLGPFCFCPNSNNNTYWCLRTINSTHNYLYCEFITGFISYYDMTKDPYQLRNAVYDLSYPTLQLMHESLEKLKTCQGTRACNMRYRPENEINRKSEKQRRKSKSRAKSVLPSSENIPWSRRGY